jgi:hypothetical protein
MPQGCRDRLGLPPSLSPQQLRFVIRQRRAKNPLYDLHVAGRRISWVAACAGDHRFRFPDGVGIRQPAIPPEREWLSALEAGAAFLPAVIHDLGRAALGQACREPGCQVYAPYRLRVLISARKA